MQEPCTPEQLADQKTMGKQGATAFVIFYPYTRDCSYAYLRPNDLRPFDPCELYASVCHMSTLAQRCLVQKAWS